MTTAIGMMDAGYFVGRKEIIDWVNETLQLSLSKVEQTASGAVACQLLDRIYPGKVPLHKVNWDAKQDYEFIGNYKVLQNAFAKLKIDKNVDVPKLVRAKYQDNLEFMQWFKRFYELNSPALDYDPVATRAGGRGAPGACSASAAAASRPAASSRASASAYAGVNKRVSSGKENSSSSSSSSSYRTSSSSTGSTVAAAAAPKKVTAAGSAKATVVVERQVDEALVQKAELLTQENAHLQATIEGLEKERDFYFEKLTVVEELLQEKQAAGAAASSETAELIEQVFKILYATGAAQPEDDAPSASAATNPVPAAAIAAVAPAPEMEPQEA